MLKFVTNETRLYVIKGYPYETFDDGAILYGSHWAQELGHYLETVMMFSDHSQFYFLDPAHMVKKSTKH